MALLSVLLPATFRKRIDHWVDLRNPASRGSIVLRNRRLYILPTRFGYIYSVMLFVLLLAAINYQNSMAYVLTFLLTAMGIVSLWKTHKNLLGLSVELKTPEPVFQDEPLPLIFKLSNYHQTTRYAVGIQYEHSPPVYAMIDPENDKNVTLSLSAIKRGLYKPSGVTIFTRFPTGLFHAWGWLKYDLPILIYPKPLFDQKLEQSLINQHSGKNTVDTADGDDFAGLREHRSGESLRHISWKAYAQGRGMLTKTFQGQATPSVWINWSDMPAKSPEVKLSQMTALVILAQKDGRKYGLNLPGLQIELATGPAHRANCLQQLAIFNQPDRLGKLSGVSDDQ